MRMSARVEDVAPARREPDEVAKDYAKTFLILAPNVIVLERLKTDFAGGRIFRADISAKK